MGPEEKWVLLNSAGGFFLWVGKIFRSKGIILGTEILSRLHHKAAK
jgi:hypothetical protein